MTQALIDNLPLIAAAPDGIKALRGLILDLAMRGKLVPQDPEDEPASELLKRIAAEKKDFSNTRRLRAGSESRRISDKEKPFSLPHGWEWARLGDVSGDIQYGFTASSDSNIKDVALLRITDIQNDTVDWDSVPGCVISDADYDNYALEDGDILIARTGGTIGKSYLISGLDRRSVFASYLIRVLRLQSTLPAYIKLFMGSEAYWIQLREHSKGTGQPNVNGTALKSLLVPFPPLAEQRRIVAKVDELMVLCDRLEAQQTDAEAVHATLVKTLLETLTQSQDADDFVANWQRLSQHFPTVFTTDSSVDALKQTVLKLAVRGKLVRQDLGDEPMGGLLKRMNVPTLTQVAFDIPDSWKWVPCGAVSQARLGKMLDKNKNRGTPRRYLRNLNVRWFDFDLSDLLEMKFEDAELPEFELKSGDVLICEGGEPGRAAVWDERDTDIYFQKALHRVRFSKCVDPHYFVKALRSSADDGRLAAYFTGSGIQHFTGRSLEKYAFPLPPLAEQHRIVAKVDELLALCDTLKTHIAESRKIQHQLAVAMVQRALAA